MNRIVKILIGAVLVVAVSAGCFYAGTVYGKGQVTAAATTAGQVRFNGGPGGFPGGPVGTPGVGGGRGQGGGQGGAFGSGSFGQIAEVGDGFVTITGNNGQQTRVEVTDTTLIEKQASATLKDLAIGETVIVSGSQGSDGTVTARSLQVSPAGRFGAVPAAGSNR